jgi:Tol biopolymer transport system component
MVVTAISRQTRTRRLLATLLLTTPAFTACGGRALGAGQTDTGGAAGADGQDAAGSAGGSGAGGTSGGNSSRGGGGGEALEPSPPSPACDEIRDRWLLFDSDQGKLARRLYAIRGDGTDRREILPVHDGLFSQPALSLDGTLLAHVDSGTVYVHDLASGAVNLSFPGDQPTWSPDVTELAFHRGSGTWLISLASGEEREVISCTSCGLGGYQNPVFTPDGSALVVDRENQITSVDLTTREERDIVKNWTTEMAHPAISPDGLWVASAIHCKHGDRYSNSLWVSEYSGTVEPCEGRLVTRGALGATNPAWGPGAWLAYERGAEGGEDHQIYAVNAESGDECPVVTEFDNRNPVWAPEGFTPPE